MILVEHAVVVTTDPSRRIFLDASVLMDGERIVQVGQSRNVRPPRAPESVIVARFSPAATARHESTSSPFHTPRESGCEKPADRKSVV